jgi:rhodanese-related sulfurtransferase
LESNESANEFTVYSVLWPERGAKPAALAATLAAAYAALRGWPAQTPGLLAAALTLPLIAWLPERIAGARLMPVSAFDPRAAATFAGGRTLVVHCRSGRRSQDACRQAARALVDAVSMAGGIEAWKSAGLPTEVDRSVAGMSIMRQVQLVVGLSVLVGAALAWFVHPAFVAIPAFFGAGLTFAGATGTCALASILGMMPWNRSALPTAAASCSKGTCG